MRGFASFQGQRNWPGWWWFSRTGEHVGYESWVERDVLMALDADPGVEAVASQPVWLHWVSESGKAAAVPLTSSIPVSGGGMRAKGSKGPFSRMNATATEALPPTHPPASNPPNDPMIRAAVPGLRAAARLGT